MRSRSCLRAALVLGCIFAMHFSTLADEPIVANQLYGLGGRFEVMLTPSMSAFDKYTRHVATSGGVAYFLNDYIGFELDAGYAFLSGDRKLLNEILSTAQNLTDIEKLPLTDLKHLTWWTTAGLVFSPLYGKLNISAELAVGVHLYFVGGAGAAEYKYSELRWSGDTFTKIEVNAGTKMSYYFGGGLRFHLAQHWGFRLEIRDVFFYDKHTVDWKPTGTGVEQKGMKDFVHTTFLRLGLCYTF